ncbi:NADH:flavin oxidoreductase [Paenibacillus sp. BK720]|uniref:oxidoreductase n=1 Tax=Paenibacillus sp. BK720 TaxID=2587092 RepID=UPI0014207664|nr:NADH:flavin oxidoreductase [Paenibacillus sp. BK720]NIK70255.1 2,4-dienoyl-CoA reductase-like NADH-dependent reductase (Old Yellow Enzyme family) [Paenibacillus sp. BK720]
MTAPKKLLSTYNLGNLTLKNRVVLAPMTRISAEKNGNATDRMARYYESFAAGGFGLVITEGTYPDEEYSQAYIGEPGIANAEHVRAWKQVTEAVHAKGGKIILQIAHAGALSMGNIYKKGTVAPSAVKPLGEQSPAFGGEGEYLTPKELRLEEIKAIIAGFAEAALRAEQAGFDGVEVHAASGYLLDEFLTDFTNLRQDEYGGSTENRVRFVTEIIRAVKEKVGQRLVVGVRISQAKANYFVHKWANGEEDARIIFEAIGAEKPDYIHITEYNALLPAFGDSGSTLAELAKKYGNTTVIANGQLDQPEDAERALEAGSDLISLGKAALANHDWVFKAENGLPIESSLDNILAPTPNLKDQELYGHAE